jgi:hypothetical protein
VLAPILGITSDANRSEGSLVSPKENSLFSKIVQLDPIQINFEISDKEVNVFIYLSDDSLHSYVGRLTLFDPIIDPKTGTFPLQAYFLNPDNLLKMGKFVFVHLEWRETRMLFWFEDVQYLKGPKENLFLWKLTTVQPTCELWKDELGETIFFSSQKAKEVFVDGVMKLKKGSPLKCISFMKNQVQMLSKFIIHRPIFVGGDLYKDGLMYTMPVSQFPEIAPPTVVVSSGTFPGAIVETKN